MVRAGVGPLRIAYLACAVTLPGAVNRRVDAFEHDQTMEALTAAFAPQGDEVEAIAWDDPRADFAAYDAAVIGTTWDYWDRHAEYLSTLRRIERLTRLYNPSSLVAWNSDKGYLAELEARGVPIPPTRFLERATPEAIAGVFDALGVGVDGEIVVKRRVGAGAAGQHRLRRGQPVPAMREPMLVQPFLPSILAEGELSFVFVDGDLSHALQKRPRRGDYRVQSAFGGEQVALEARADDVASARAVLDRLDVLPLYARVDMVRGEGGRLALMELEVIEPFLYPLQGPRLGAMMHAALRRRCVRPR
ncbi:MAG: hypothetical protein U0414_10080 [Polyangiaceae bacterium]